MNNILKSPLSVHHAVYSVVSASIKSDLLEVEATTMSSGMNMLSTKGF